MSDATATATSPPRAPVLTMQGITKSFAGTLALDHVDLEVAGGTVHGLVGENGAGKSTLLKILAGDHRAASGTIEIDGAPVSIEDPVSAREHGIGIVYQELSLLPNLTVAENVSLGVEPSRRLALDRAAIATTAREALDALGVAFIDPQRRVSHLSLPERQLVEIARVLTLRQPRLIVFDEPTAALNFADVERLFATIRRLRDAGVGIVFVSHRYREVLEICDACTVLRNGRRVGSLSRADATLERLVELTLGRRAQPVARPAGPAAGSDGGAAPGAGTAGQPPARRADRPPPVLVVAGLSIGALVHDVAFEVRAGEIVSLCGLLGMGQTDIARAVFGDGARVAGSVRILGHEGRPRSARQAVRLGVGLIPESRQEEGLFPDMTVRANITISSLGSLVVARAVRVLSRRRERAAARAAGERAGVNPAVLGRPVRTLSGGNQQKSLLARWLLRGCRLLVCIEPTRGVDVGAKAEIYRQLAGLARDGAGVLVVSTDLPEVLAISDRVYVVYRGTMSPGLDAAGLDETRLLLAMQGGAAEVAAGVAPAPPAEGPEVVAVDAEVR